MQIGLIVEKLTHFVNEMPWTLELIWHENQLVTDLFSFSSGGTCRAARHRPKECDEKVHDKKIFAKQEKILLHPVMIEETSLRFLQITYSRISAATGFKFSYRPSDVHVRV